VISISACFRKLIRSLIHQAASVTLDFHESNATNPLPQFCQKGENDIKVHYLFRIRVKVMTAPLAENI
jgi:hypothetical protein